MKKIILIMTTILGLHISNAQNVGIGTNSPTAKLHVNGDLRLQYGEPVNKFSRDSLFSANSHLNVPTEKAVKDYIRQGAWAVTDFSLPGPNAPAVRSFAVIDWDDANCIAVKGSFAYLLSGGGNSLHIFDISNPDILIGRGSISTNLDLPTSVFVAGNYAYVTSAQNNKLCIFDVSNPDAIVAKATTTMNMDYPRAVVVQGNYAYVTSDFLQRLSIFDISNPNLIVAKGTGGLGITAPTSLDVQGNYAYVTSYSAGELQIYDISNPNTIIPKAFTTANLSGPRSVDVVGNYAYVASRDNNRICVFDITNPNAIVTKGSTTAGLNAPNSIKVLGNYAMLTSFGSGRLSLFDISNPGSVLEKGSTNGSLIQPMFVTAQGTYIYVANKGNSRGLCVFDMDPSRSISITPEGVQPLPQPWQTLEKNIYRSNGRVGIGTSIPQEALDVYGNIQSSGSLKSASLNTNNASIGNAIINSATLTDASLSSITISNTLNFSNNLSNKISLYGANASTQYGFGVQGGLFQMYSDAISADIAFGYGTSTAFSERMRIKGTGNVGIGITNPSSPLSFPASLSKKISLYPGGTGDVGMSVSGNDFRLYSDNVNARVSFGYDDYVNGFISRAYVPASGPVALVVQGQLNVNGTLYNSDLRYKKNIHPLQNSLKKVMQLRGVEYEMRTDEFPAMQFADTKQIGLIAQEVEQLIPEVVTTNTDGYKSVDYAKLVPLLTEAIKELSQQNEALQKRVENLEKERIKK